MSQIFKTLNSGGPFPPNVPTSFPTDSGTATPSENMLNVLGNNDAQNGFAAWTTAPGSINTVQVNSYGTAKWVVNPTEGVGTHQTISAASASASAGDTIFITPGTYVENPTLTAGVSYVGYVGNQFPGSVIIQGTCTFSGTGTVSMTGIEFLTNSNYSLVVSGSNQSQLTLTNCYFNVSNFTAISFTSSNSNSGLSIFYCSGNISSNGISLFNKSSPGGMTLYWCTILSSGNSTTASTTSSGGISIYFCNLLFPITSSSTASIGLQYSIFNTSAMNTVCINHGGTGQSLLNYCYFSTGSAAAISISSGAALNISHSNFTSTAANVITGSGTINYNEMTYSGTSNSVNVSTQNPLPIQPGAVNIVAPSSYPYTALGTDCVIAVNTSAAANTVDLPASPSNGQFYRIKDKSANAATYNITISGNGKNIVGSTSASSFTINTNGGSVDLVYDSIDSVWLVL